jgi:hypothetical protein
MDGCDFHDDSERSESFGQASIVDHAFGRPLCMAAERPVAAFTESRGGRLLATFDARSSKDHLFRHG